MSFEYSKAAEEAVIGSCLVSNKAMAEALSQGVSKDWFPTPQFREAWEIMTNLWTKQRTVDLVLVADRMGAGAMFTLGTIAKNTASPNNIGSYVDGLRRLSQRYQLYHLGQKAACVANTRMTASELDELTSDFMSLGQTRGKTLTRLRDALKDFVEEATDERPDAPDLFPPLHAKTGGFHPGDLIILAGRPGMGKTALGLQLAMAAATHGPVLVQSLEMDNNSLTGRIVSSRKASVSDIRNRKLDDNAWDALNEKCRSVRDMPLFMDEDTDVTMSQVMAQAMMIKQQEGSLAMVMIDYLQLMQGDGKNREQQIAGITRSAKKMAKKLGCPVLLLSQLNRKVEDRQDKRPMISDLRESGAIEQDADIILMLYRKGQYETVTDDIGEIIVAKHRHGKPGVAYVEYVGEETRWVSAHEELVKDYVHPPVQWGKDKRKGEM